MPCSKLMKIILYTKKPEVEKRRNVSHTGYLAFGKKRKNLGKPLYRYKNIGNFVPSRVIYLAGLR